MYKLVCLASTLTLVVSQIQNRPVAIVKYLNDISPDGSYEYAYETENGIYVQEEGRARQSPNSQSPDDLTLAVQGSFLYTSPEGQQIQVAYTADENGFQPQGEHLPTPPPIPPAILRALEWNRAHPEEDNSI